MDHIQLLCDIDELNSLFKESVSVQTLLQKTVRMVAEHTDSEVCSIYLYNEETQDLTLTATHGLNMEAVGTVKMKLGHGLTGVAVKELRPICETSASSSPDFQYFPGIFEEQFDCFLAVPIKRGISRIGALVLQRRKGHFFNDAAISALEAVASQLANIIENARFLMDIHEPPPEKLRDRLPENLSVVRGKVASEGFAFGQSMLIDRNKTLALLLHQEFDEHYTLEDFDKAMNKTSEQLSGLQTQVEEKLSDAASLIFAAHLVILRDRQFVGEIRSLIEGGENAPTALLNVSNRYIENFAASTSPYTREKVQDIQDLVVRILGNLINEVEEIAKCKGRVIISRELFPSDLLVLSSEEAAGVILVGGGVTSHLSILARSLRIPTIIMKNADLLNLPDHTPVLLDAEVGNVYVDPSDEVLDRFEKQQSTRISLEDQKHQVKEETFTRDGTKITLLANINLLSDLSLASGMKSEGVGLYRTEFPFIIRNTFPTEEEQYAIYSRLFDVMGERPVTIRTLDVGGDKILSYYNDVKENNPVLGLRSIRFSLQNRDVFAEQIRAILRAGTGHDLRIMFPMISSLDEFGEAREMVTACQDELQAKGKEFHSSPKIGMMVELPSVVDLIDDFAQEADFFSIGTNDFIQFMLGVDRTNENVAQFYLPYHPSVVRGLNKVAAAAMRNGREVSICGDMPSNTKYLPLLIGIGIRTLSLNPVAILKVQQAIGEIDIEDAMKAAELILSKSRVSEIAEILGLNE